MQKKTYFSPDEVVFQNCEIEKCFYFVLNVIESAILVDICFLSEDFKDAESLYSAFSIR